MDNEANDNSAVKKPSGSSLATPPSPGGRGRGKAPPPRMPWGFVYATDANDELAQLGEALQRSLVLDAAAGSRTASARPRGRPSRYGAAQLPTSRAAERAAAREVLEETNVKVSAVSLVASQPWPCGRGNSCELMLAMVARAAGRRRAGA